MTDNNQHVRRLLGIAGTFASGKDTLAEWLETKGFYHVSTSNMVRAGSQDKYGSTDRKHLHVYANETREAEGAGIFLDRALMQAVDYDNVVISGIRSIGEVEALKAAGGKLIFMDAPIEIRYKRAFSRGRDEADVSFDSFKASEEKELHKPEELKTDQNIGAMKRHADIILENDDNIDSFYADAAKALELDDQICSYQTLKCENYVAISNLKKF